MLAETVAECAGAEIDMEAVQTNIVIFTVPGEGAALRLVADLRSRGVLSSVVGPEQVRLVTHADVSRTECERAAGLLRELLR